MEYEKMKDVTIGTLEQVFYTACCVVFFSIIIPLLAVFIFFITGLGSLVLDNVSTFEQFESNPSVTFVVSLISLFLIVPLLKYSLYSSIRTQIMARLAIRSVHLCPFFCVLIAVFVYMVVEYYLAEYLMVEAPNFMLEMQAQTNNLLDKSLLFFSVVVIAPIFEEVIFRGVAFYRLQQTVLGVSGAVIIPSLIFTFLHGQYDQADIFVLLFVFSCFMGGIRSLSGNIWYCVLGHMIINLFAISEFIL